MLINSIKTINKFFDINVQKSPNEVFTVLNEIISFDSGYIYLSGALAYSYNASKNFKYSITESLHIQNAQFGTIEITRDKEFSEEEILIFRTCASIIANLIKDIEISKIINMQVKALQEGILETNEAYKSEKNKNDFFANFSHELKTPLNSIISSSELISEQIFGPLNEKQLEYINDIRISGLHLLGMINDILDMAKLEAKSMQLNPTEFDITQTAEDVYNIIKPLALRKQISIQKEYDQDIIIYADRQKIQQILFNLTSNAIKYTPDNGAITITITKIENNIKIKVKDNGIGIDKAFHEKIFDKFVQLGNQKHSNGLGLTITKELVKLHNGEITLNSIPQQGSEFTVIIPTSCF